MTISLHILAQIHHLIRSIHIYGIRESKDMNIFKGVDIYKLSYKGELLPYHTVTALSTL